MRRRSLLNLGLSVLILLSALLIWWLQPAPLPPLTSLTSAQIERIGIRDADRDIHLVKRANRWWLGGQPADARRIEQLLGICDTPSLRRFQAPLARLGEFGLAPPALHLRLNELELAFGGTDPLHGWRYVRVGERIHLIGDGFRHHLFAPAEAFLEAP